MCHISVRDRTIYFLVSTPSSLFWDQSFKGPDLNPGSCRIFARILALLRFCGFPQSFQANPQRISYIRPIIHIIRRVVYVAKGTYVYVINPYQECNDLKFQKLNLEKKNAYFLGCTLQHVSELLKLMLYLYKLCFNNMV